MKLFQRCGNGGKYSRLAILVVAADDSVKPQTLEAIEQVKNEGFHLLWLQTDRSSRCKYGKVKKDLAKAGVQVEGFGGDVPILRFQPKIIPESESYWR